MPTQGIGEKYSLVPGADLPLKSIGSLLTHYWSRSKIPHNPIVYLLLCAM